jgi:hypothetical protein
MVTQPLALNFLQINLLIRSLFEYGKLSTNHTIKHVISYDHSKNYQKCCRRFHWCAIR